MPGAAALFAGYTALLALAGAASMIRRDVA
jgi:hypothetical protein